MRRLALWSVLCTVTAAACGGTDEASDADAAAEAAAPSAEDVALDALRQATSQYEDVNVALAEGYIQAPDGACVDATMIGAPASMGAMGVHYLHPALLGVAMPPAPGRITGGDGMIDDARPEVLVYEPQADGSMKLVAVEYLVFEKAWQAAGNTGQPMYAGTPFVHMADDPATEMDEAHGFEPHYELHVWLYRDNPSGRFAEWNPNVSCAHAMPSM
jgi:hypothetical protein